MSKTTIDGTALQTGVNLDDVNVQAGVAEARKIGYTSGNEVMLVDYCLSRWAKGEEALAESTALHLGIDLTSWYRILAAARAHVHQGKHRTKLSGDQR